MSHVRFLLYDVGRRSPYKRYYTSIAHTVRVRFAPSPTGFIHLGGLRTALYNYLFAKSKNGIFVLRIEDTDQSRIVPGAVEAIIHDLQWAGIDIDEGPRTGNALFGPYIQSERVPLYGMLADLLVAREHAYYCFCTEKRLDLLRREAARLHEVPKYDNKCRYLSPDSIIRKLKDKTPYCIRFKLSNDPVQINDIVYGPLTITLNEGDPVILKADGYPTYHLANVVDDHLMHITHVLRGVEWQISTPKHLQLYKAFGWPIPHYGHLPLLLNEDGSKLSKRQNDIQVQSIRESGIMPQALVNFVLQSGGLPHDLYSNDECLDMNKLAKQFTLEKVSTNSGKLQWDRLRQFNRQELLNLMRENPAILVQDLKFLVQQNFNASKNQPGFVLNLDNDYIKHVLEWALLRITSLIELINKDYQFVWTVPNAQARSSISDSHKALIGLLVDQCENANIPNAFKRDVLALMLKQFCIENEVKYSELMKTLRVALSGLKEGPSVAEIMEVIGKEETVRRLHLCNTKDGTGYQVSQA